ncbi:unnamed protein product [Dovyalis caffra]|uniref:Uncharacterized protein n=1 Tax=Dovyalis caffra TaxID=77055 RepID=A0AAV1R0P7_9ROSI|nr:unnamed protein product [Dovyalis caffra]
MVFVRVNMERAKSEERDFIVYLRGLRLAYETGKEQDKINPLSLNKMEQKSGYGIGFIYTANLSKSEIILSCTVLCTKNCLKLNWGVVDGDGIATTSIKRIGGRKMVLAPSGIKRSDIKGNGALGGTSKISSANDQAVGKYVYELGKKVTSIGRNKGNGSRFSEGINDSGFVAFNADYHQPRHHPPKNN